TASSPVTVSFCVAKPLPEGAAAGTEPECKEGLKTQTGEITVRLDQLQSFTLSADGASLPALGTLQLRALGKFTSGLEQDITRHVAWSSGDTALALVGSTSGLAASRKPEDGQVTFTATNNDATATKTQELPINVVKPAGAP
ncbi:MAG: hypothetical protein ACREUF_05910, partial [Solimonas sp.]